MYQIWIKDGVSEENLKELKEKGLIGEFHLQKDSSSNKRYVSIYEDICDPIASIPNIPKDIIERTTLKEHIICGFRTEGVYHHKGTVLLVKSGVKHSMRSYDDSLDKWQDIMASAPNIAALKASYALLRQGKLVPQENWEQEQRFVPKPKK